MRLLFAPIAALCLLAVPACVKTSSSGGMSAPQASAIANDLGQLLSDAATPTCASLTTNAIESTLCQAGAGILITVAEAKAQGLITKKLVTK